MQKQLLIQQIEKLALEANKEGGSSNAAIVLFALCGAIISKKDVELALLCKEFAKTSLRELRAPLN